VKHFAPIAAAVAAFAALGLQPALAQNNNSGELKRKIPGDIIINKPYSAKDAVPNMGCTFYEHINGRGQAWHVKVGWKLRETADLVMFREQLNTFGDYWNDRVSSVKCDRAGKVICSAFLYDNANLSGSGGKPAIIHADQLVNLNVNELNYYRTDGFDDKASSAIISCTRRLK